MASLVMLVPTLALGVTFPAVTAILAEKTEILGRRLGKAYGFNSIVFGAVLNLAAGSLVAPAAARPLKARLVPVGFASAGLLALVGVLSPWSPRVINSGVYVYADRYRKIIDGIFESPWGPVTVEVGLTQ